MDTDSVFNTVCPLAEHTVTLTVSATIGNDCGCALSMEDMEVSCSEKSCPFLHRKGCLTDPFLPDQEA